MIESISLTDSFKMCRTLLLVVVLIIDHVNCLLACFFICREITHIFAGKLMQKRSEARKLACWPSKTHSQKYLTATSNVIIAIYLFCFAHKRVDMLICTYLVDILLIFASVFKDRTKSRAEAKNVNTARLPIEEYMKRKSEPGNHSFSKVLTVNQGTVNSR